MTTPHAIRKKLGKKFKVGDVVTWGHKFVAHRVVIVERDGVHVDATSSGFGELQPDGRRFVFVPFVPTGCSKGLKGPPEHTDMAPDQEPTWKRLARQT